MVKRHRHQDWIYSELLYDVGVFLRDTRVVLVTMVSSWHKTLHGSKRTGGSLWPWCLFSKEHAIEVSVVFFRWTAHLLIQTSTKIGHCIDWLTYSVWSPASCSRDNKVVVGSLLKKALGGETDLLQGPLHPGAWWVGHLDLSHIGQ